MALLGMKRSRSSLAVAINRGGERRSPATVASRYEQPVRHCFDRCRSCVPGPSCLINFGGREITPGAIDETQIQSLASERRGARCSARGFLKAERWRAPLNVADLAVANLSFNPFQGSYYFETLALPRLTDIIVCPCCEVNAGCVGHFCYNMSLRSLALRERI